MIDLPPQDLTTIKRILAKHIPEGEVRAFGSRVTWTAKSHSDLDLVIIAKEKLPRGVISSLKSEFEDSALQMRVDLLDWHRISHDFQKNISKHYETIQHARDADNIPKGWMYRKVSEIAEVIGGGTPMTKKPEYWGGDTPWLTPKDLSGDHPRYVARGERNITKKGLQNCSARILPPKTVLLTSRAPVGHLAMAKNPITTNQGFRSLIVNTENDSEFVYYLLLNNTDYLKQHAAGSTFQELSGSVLKSLEFLLPPLPEQRAIAHILGSLDNKIELNRRMNQTLEATARAIFKSWFVDFDPVRAKAESRPTGLPDDIAALFPDSFEDSEIGKTPKGWELRSLFDCAKYINGAAYRSLHFADEVGALPVVKIAELKSGVTSQTKFTKAELDDKYRISNGEILLSWSGNLDTSIGTFIWCGGPAWLNKHIFRVLPHQEIEKHFVFYLLKYLRPVFAETARDKQTSGLRHFIARDMKRLMVVHPPENILAIFNDSVGPVFDRWYRNLFESNTLSSLRETLLPKLISGELRVPDAEKLAREPGV